jgi:transcriptional regulator
MSDPIFAPRSAADVVRMIAANPLAWIISRDFRATPLPLLAESDGNGAIIALLGHFARRNPQVASLTADPDALILFQGPQGYISPTLVSNATWGPTWNYAVARFEVEIEFLEGQAAAAVERLADHLEPDGNWTVATMGSRYEQLTDHIIAFRAHIRAADMTFKLGQDEKPETFAEIVEGLGDTGLADMMREQRMPDPVCQPDMVG